jgi:hypothetical protein
MTASSTYDGIETKREPSPTEVALLELAKAIDSLEAAMREQERSIDRMAEILETIEKREHWIDGYRAHARDGLPAL